MLIYPKYAKDINHKNKFLKKIIDIQLFISKINVINEIINIYTQNTLSSISVLEENMATEKIFMTKLDTINSVFICHNETIPILRKELAITKTQKNYFS